MKLSSLLATAACSGTIAIAQTTPPAASPAPATSSMSEDSYLLGPGDTIAIVPVKAVRSMPTAA